MANRWPQRPVRPKRKATQKPCAKIESIGESAPPSSLTRPPLQYVDLANSRGNSGTNIQQSLQSRVGAGKDRRAVSKKHSLRLATQKFLQRPPHLFLVQAIFPGEKGETRRFEVNQRVANEQRAIIRWTVKCDLAGHCPLDANHLQLVADFCAVDDFYEPRWLLASKTLTLREDRH